MILNSKNRIKCLLFSLEWNIIKCGNLFSKWITYIYNYINRSLIKMSVFNNNYEIKLILVIGRLKYSYKYINLNQIVYILVLLKFSMQFN